MKHFFVFSALFFLAGAVSAQDNDSLELERERKLLEGVTYDYNVIKFNIANTFVGGINPIYERRTNLNISCLADVDWNFNKERRHQEIALGVRYYYNLEQRILDNLENKNRKTSCLAANYFQGDILVGHYIGTRYWEEELNGWSFGPMLKVGMQRKFWKYCFWDGWIGYTTPLPDRRPKDDRIIRFGTFRFGFVFGIDF
ncbi:MAG: hypothetical protein FD123_2271 [Bacteroidetes bacterium]|nr:MAG: hypothetical protein FD123_2271 [Bacteroidota bacterium]